MDGVFFIDSLLDELITTLSSSTYPSFLNFPHLVHYFFNENYTLTFGAYGFYGPFN